MWTEIIKRLPVSDLLNVKLSCKPLYQCTASFFKVVDYKAKPSIKEIPLSKSKSDPYRPYPFLYSEEGHNTFVVSPNGEMIAYLDKSGDHIRVCDVQGKQLAKFFASLNLKTFVFTTDNQFLVSSYSNSKIYVDRISKQEKHLSYTYSFNDNLPDKDLLDKHQSLHIKPLTDSLLIVAPHKAFSLLDTTFFGLFDLNSKKFTPHFNSGNDSFDAIELSHDKTRLAAINSRTNGMEIYDVKSGELLERMNDPDGYLLHLAFMPDNNIMTLSRHPHELTYGLFIQLWHTQDGLKSSWLLGENLNLVSAAVKGNTIALYLNDFSDKNNMFSTIQILNYDSKKLTFHSYQTLPQPCENRRLAFNKGELIAIGEEDIIRYQFPSTLLQTLLQDNLKATQENQEQKTESLRLGFNSF